jgi:hypothetical protein
VLKQIFSQEVFGIHRYYEASRDSATRIAFIVIDIMSGGVVVPISQKMREQCGREAVGLDYFQQNDCWDELKVDLAEAPGWAAALAEGLELVSRLITSSKTVL